MKHNAKLFGEHSKTHVPPFHFHVMRKSVTFSVSLSVFPRSVFLSVSEQKDFFLLGTATTVEEAIRNKEAGVDAIVLQGLEAGAHRGTFLPYKSLEDTLIPTATLVQQVQRAFGSECAIPLIAAGGIVSTAGKEVAQFLHSGCAAVQIGTAFLTCRESGSAKVYRDALLASSTRKKTYTTVFTGRFARALHNEFISIINEHFTPNQIPPFPFQHMLTTDIRSAAAKQGKVEYLHLWAGESVRMCQDGQSASELIKKIVEETDNEFELLIKRQNLHL